LKRRKDVNEKLLADRMAAVANRVDDSDWVDVQRRVSAAAPRRRRSVSVAAVVVGTLVVAGAALGLGYQLFDLSVGDPAPPPVQRAFDRMDRSRLDAARTMRREAGIDRQVDVQIRRARLVGRVRARNGRRVFFWAAPTTRGWCWALQYLHFRNPAHHFMEGGCGRGPAFAFDTHSFVGGRLYAGRVGPRVATLELAIGTAPLAELPRRRVRLRNGFYLFDAPEGILARIIGRDARGRVLFVREDFA
jgi:hypothetical protein